MMELSGKSEEFLDFCHSAFDNIPIAVDFLDKDGNMIYINQAFSDFLEIPIDKMLNRSVISINPTSKFMETLQKKRPDIAIRHSFPNGKQAICHRIPIFNNAGEVIGGFGMLLFEEYQQMQVLLDKCNTLDREVQHYRKLAADMNRTKYTLHNIIGDSIPIRVCKKQVKKLAGVNMDVLIIGESGVGKELFAHSIHSESNRSEMPFVTINCSAIPENLLESELFGYEGGSFTGAKRGGSIGKFELANGGTLFLDEIGDMPYYMQAKILRALQEKEILPVGGKAAKPVDVRIVSATHKDLQSMIHAGTFREDLYYRLNVLSLVIPPLRERPEDIPMLTEHFLIEFRKQSGLVRKISPEALRILQNYSWPGNIRELRNAVDYSCVNSDRPEIHPEDLPQFLSVQWSETAGYKSSRLNELLSQTEQDAILDALRRCGGNKVQAAKLLGIPRIRLYRQLQKIEEGKDSAMQTGTPHTGHGDLLQ